MKPTKPWQTASGLELFRARGSRAPRPDLGLGVEFRMLPSRSWNVVLKHPPQNHTKLWDQSCLPQCTMDKDMVAKEGGGARSWQVGLQGLSRHEPGFEYGLARATMSSFGISYESIYLCIYIYVCIYIYMHTYIHTCYVRICRYICV